MMTVCLTLLLFLAPVPLQAQQPAPPFGLSPPQAGVVYGPHGGRYQTFQTPTGLVTYDQTGQRWQTFETPTGTVTYDQHGHSWRAFPGPIDRQPQQR